MTEFTISEALMNQVDPNETPEARVKRLRIRSWRRGIKEMDLILGGWADKFLADAGPEMLDLYEKVLTESDHDLYQWVSGQEPAPEVYADFMAELAKHARQI